MTTIDLYSKWNSFIENLAIHFLSAKKSCPRVCLVDRKKWTKVEFAIFSYPHFSRIRRKLLFSILIIYDRPVYQTKERLQGYKLQQELARSQLLFKGQMYETCTIEWIFTIFPDENFRVFFFFPIHGRRAQKTLYSSR